MTKTAYIGIFALLLLMVLVNVLFDRLTDPNGTQASTSVQAAESEQPAPTQTTPGQERPPTHRPPVEEVNVPEAPTVPMETASGGITPPILALPAVAAAQTFHAVVNGDTCWELAVKYYGDGRMWTKIRDANANLVSPQGHLKLRTKLAIPDAGAITPAVVEPPTETIPTVIAGGTTLVARTGKQHKVKFGDSCWELAKDHYGDGSKWRQIREANPDKIGAHGELTTGQVILLPEVH